jgi:hypothetical protein
MIGYRNPEEARRREAYQADKDSIDRFTRMRAALAPSHNRQLEARTEAGFGILGDVVYLDDYRKTPSGETDTEMSPSRPYDWAAEASDQVDAM